MCDENDYSIISFPSTHHAMAGEKIAMSVCKENEARLIPVPPEVSAGCGLALKIPSNELDIVLKTLNEEGIKPESAFFVKCSKGKKTYIQKDEL